MRTAALSYLSVARRDRARCRFKATKAPPAKRRKKPKSLSIERLFLCAGLYAAGHTFLHPVPDLAAVMAVTTHGFIHLIMQTLLAHFC
ncbi:hypothetical protein G163CM_08750 [Pseudocitrobacter corydidari]|uniref:Uncharacterized protein n=1 Tax=Pseudocitrobacter corydidari TaxID=2891570 RepID=A0ABY3S0I0_9ENTR|nr:hypothetical protein G163CM_08750 [Pseudocitrobacter corydidari]